MSILILAVVLIPLLTALFLKVIGKFLNELLTNFITLNAAMLSVGVSFFLFGCWVVSWLILKLLRRQCGLPGGRWWFVGFIFFIWLLGLCLG